jgi:type IV secretion system protein TrbC
MIKKLSRLANRALSVSATAMATIACLATQAAYAAVASNGLPWEAPLQTIRDSITGPAGFSVSIMALGGSGMMIIMGGEMGEFMRMAAKMAFGISMLVLAGQFMAVVFPTASGAVIL